jgi:TetR/AcrR family transcriptional regulator, tetracycline repressor protein
MARPRKSLIAKRETLETALRVCDEDGLDAVSIRRLGRELDVQGISLYHYFQNKDEILLGLCQLALTDVRTPKSADLDWKDWLLQDVFNYRAALRAHPNLLPLFIRWHPLRIGLDERNSAAGLLAVQGVPPRMIMPLLEALEAFVLGSVAYEIAIARDDIYENGLPDYPHLYHLSRASALTYDETFKVIARTIVDKFSSDAAAAPVKR